MGTGFFPWGSPVSCYVYRWIKRWCGVGDGLVALFRLDEYYRVAWVDPGEFDVYDIYPAWREALRAVTGE